MIRSLFATVVVFGAVVSVSAHAEGRHVSDGFKVHALHCRTLRFPSDAGTVVSVDQVVVPGDSARSGLEATVSLKTFAGLRPVGSVKVREVRSSALGSPLRYEGKDFDLSVNFTTTPVDGGAFSHLTADLDGTRFNEDMVCYRVR